MFIVRIERYFYSDRKEEWSQYVEQLQESLAERNETGEINDKDIRMFLDEVLSPLQAQRFSIVDPRKYHRFCELAEQSVSLAEELRANLLVDTEDFTGCIAFVGDEMSFTKAIKTKFEEFADAADEVHIKLSSDYGENSPTDIEGAVQLEYWFDYYQCVQIS